MKALVFIALLAIYLLTTTLPSCSAEPITTVGTLGFISTIFTLIGFFWSPASLLSSSGPIDNSFFIFMRAIDEVQISEKLANIEKGLEKIYEHVPQYTNHIKQLHDHEKRINNIDNKYSLMLDITRKLANGTKLNPKDKELIDKDSNEYLGTGDGSLYETVTTIYDTFIKTDSSTLKYLKKAMQKHQVPPCTEAGELQSNQQSFLHLIISIVFAQAKVYLTAGMAAKYFNKTSGVYPTLRFNTISEKVNNQYKDTVKLFKDLMPYASRDVWVCDPEPHIENTTFFQLVNVFQQQIVDRYNTDKYLFGYKTFHYPGRYKQLDYYNLYKFRAGMHIAYYDLNQQRQVDLLGGLILKNSIICPGYLWDCEPLNELLDESEEERAYLVCHSSASSIRRYERLESHEFQLWEFSNTAAASFRKSFGQEKLCDFWYHNRSVILNAGVCTCDETTSDVPTLVRSHYSYRFFFIGDVVATEKDNYVVTGARIGQYQGVIYPIIQEGKLLKEGVVNQSTLRWIDQAQNEIGRKRLTLQSNIVKIDYTDRTIKLGNIDLPAGQVLKGLYFTRKNRNNEVEGPLRLALVWRTFNFTTGKVKGLEGPYQQIKDDYGNRGTERFDKLNSDMVQLKNLPLPKLDEKSTSIVTDGYLNFTTSHFKTDLGQTTIPYIDAQNLMTEIPTPMSGAGIYYKHRPGHAGFIGITLKTYDVSPYIQEPQATIPESIKQAIQEEALLLDGSSGVLLN